MKWSLHLCICKGSQNDFAVAQCEDLKVKYSEEQAKRKELYNQIQETKGKGFFSLPSSYVMQHLQFVIRDKGGITLLHSLFNIR